MQYAVSCLQGDRPANGGKKLPAAWSGGKERSKRVGKGSRAAMDVSMNPEKVPASGHGQPGAEYADPDAVGLSDGYSGLPGSVIT
jgi:hypothetical protein